MTSMTTLDDLFAALRAIPRLPVRSAAVNTTCSTTRHTRRSARTMRPMPSASQLHGVV